MIFVWMFLLPLVILFLVLLGAGLTLVRAILRFLGFSSKATSAQNGSGSTSSKRSEQTSSTYSSASVSGQRKIIGDDEGEYVEFEEVKE